MTTAKVPLLDLEAQNGPLRGPILEAIARVVASNQFIMGPDVAAFEKEVADALSVAHAIGVSSGTDALIVALMALDVGPGDEVVTTPFSFFATAGSIARLGAKPVFVDIDPRTFNLDASKLEAAITERTKAVMPVHLFGQSCDMDVISDIAARRGIAVVEDAAQAIGARHPRGPVGALGAFGCFSFFPSKNLGCFGDGGLVTTMDEGLAERVRVLRAHGAKPKYFHHVIGGNFRLDTIQAAVLRVKLPHLAAWAEGRRRNAARYDARFAEASLPDGALVTPLRAYEGHVYNQYVIRSPRRAALEAHLSAAGVGHIVYYPKPLHLQGCFASLGYREGDLPEAERACHEVLALPIYAELTESQQDRVIDAVLEASRA